MQLNIIHLPERTDRMILLQRELKEQNISDYKIWEGVISSDFPPTGISKAHKQIIRYAKENKFSEVLIAEDDLHFTSKCSFQFYLQNKPEDYDIYLASIHEGEINKENIVHDFSGLTCYMVNERFYDVFLSVQENMNLDRGLRNKGKYIVCNPFTVIQHNGFSDNIKQSLNYDKFLEKRKLYM